MVNYVSPFFLELLLEMDLILQSAELDSAGVEERLGAYLGRCSSVSLVTRGRNEAR